MAQGFIKRTLATVLVYIVVFIGAVLLQFSSPAGFSWKSGIVSISSSQGSSKRASPEAARISVGGVRIVVDAKHPAIALMADGGSRNLELIGVGSAEGVAILRFSNEVVLKASGGPKGEGPLTSFEVGSGDSRILSLRLALEGSPTEGPTGPSITEGGKTWQIGLPRGAIAEGRVDLPVDQKVTIQKVQPTIAKQTPVTVKSELDFRQGVLAWVDRAWAGISGTRFEAASLRWKGPDGNYSFSETALLVLIAEAQRRGTGGEILAKARIARERYPQYLSYLSVPWLGSTAAQMSQLESLDAREARRLTALVAAADPSVLDTPDLLPRLVDRSPRGLYQDALHMIAALDPLQLPAARLVGLLEVAGASNDLIRGGGENLPQLGAAEARILSILLKAEGGQFLPTGGEGRVDVALSLRAGIALMALGRGEGKDLLLASGQSLVEGALSLASEDGSLPAEVMVANGAVASRAGVILPETIYPALAANPYYPHEVSFAKDLEPGVWAWTCATELSVQNLTGRRVFSAKFPLGSTHYLALYGIPAFSKVRLYGIDYGQDSQFESYSVSGYSYKASAGALYVKMVHKAETEGIELFF